MSHTNPPARELPKISKEIADTMRNGIDLLEEGNEMLMAQVASIICGPHPNAADAWDNPVTEEFRATIYGLYIKQSGQEMFFHMAPMEVE